MIDVRLIAGILTGGSAGLLVVLWLLWKWQDRRDERWVREWWNRYEIRRGGR